MDPITSSSIAAAGGKSSQALRPEGEVGRIHQTAIEFEGVFIGMLLKAMRSSVGSGGLFKNGSDTQTYREMFDQQIGQQIAKGGGIGLAQLVLRDHALRQVTENQGKKPAADVRIAPSSLDASSSGAAVTQQAVVISPPEKKVLKLPLRTADRTTDGISPTGNGGANEDPE